MVLVAVCDLIIVLCNIHIYYITFIEATTDFKYYSVDLFTPEELIFISKTFGYIYIYIYIVYMSETIASYFWC